MDESPKKTMIKSAQTTFRILEAIKEQDKATAAELTDEFPLTKSSIHNYLNTLEHEGYIVREDNTYRLGLQLLELGGYARHKQRLYQSSKDELTKLAVETGEMANLLIEEDGRGIYLYRANGEQAVASDSYIGHRVHLHNTALGLTILAHLPHERVDEIIEQHGLPQTTKNTISDRNVLFERLNRVREQGVAFDDEERLKGLRCVAIPIVDKNDEVKGAISISGPMSRFQGEYYQTELLAKLKTAGNMIELNINYS